MAGHDLRFLLHLWRDERGYVHASLRDVTDGRLRLFTGLDDLSNFLRTSAEAPVGARHAPEDGPTRGGGPT